MPQISQIGEIYASQLLWLAIFFGAIFFVIGLGMLPKVMSTVDARDAKIAADIKSAEGAREAADALEEAYRTEMDKSRAESAKLAADAKASAAKEAETQVRAADADIDGRLDDAMKGIAAARTSAMAEIEAVAASAVQELTSKVAGLTVDMDAARVAVARELTHA